MGTQDLKPDGIYPIRAWVWIKILTHGYTNGQKVMPIEYTGVGMVLSPEPANPWAYVYPVCI
jgi:hypothetical protein